MSEHSTETGHCLCGLVTFKAPRANHSVNACHCDMCRRWGGGVFMARGCDREVEFSGVEHIEVFDSSAWAERGFCKRCGSHLFYRLKDSGEYEVPAGLFDSMPKDLSFAL